MAISHYLASHPPVLPPHSATATTVPLPNLMNMVYLKSIVEQSSGKQFGTPELSRLAWLWSWDGETLPAESSSSTTKSDNPFLTNTPEAPKQVVGLTFLITSTRTLDRAGRRVNTHGIGLELELQRAGETREVLMGGALGGFDNEGVGGGVRVLGRWSATADVREAELRRRLERWVDLHGGEEEAPQASHLPTPSTRGSERSKVPPIPLLPLPKHAPMSSSLFSSPLSFSDSSPSKPLPTSTLPLAKAIPPGLSDPFEIQKPKVAHTGSVKERRQALYDRIKAKSNRPTLAEAISDEAGVIHRSPDHNILRQRATLSRLESVAETVWFLFSSGINSPRSRRAIPTSEVTEQIVKSSKTPISEREAQTSLDLLIRLCPFFLITKRVGRNDWLEMPATVVCPPSPDNGVALGPASPGRVRRTAGLRDVRERIRRELEK